jgi:ligand-binding SRPBCC domain-containing protein
VRIRVQLAIAAPPEIVFRFYTRLDHLRFISPRYRQEWCTSPGAIVALGGESEVRIQQHRHGVTVRFRTVRLEADRFLEDEFLSWPVKGARHTVRLEPGKNGETLLEDVITWEPPWYLRRTIERYLAEQQKFFEERQAKAKQIIEAVYAARGGEAFVEGIFPDAERVGIAPVVDTPF